MNKDYDKRLKWFTDRIGKTVYRDNTSCDCIVCEYVVIEGLTILDKLHAHYLNDCSFEMGIEYRDNK